MNLSKLLFSALLFVSAAASAQIPQVPVEQLAPRWGFQHTHICTDSSWGCGSNPPTWHVPADGVTPGSGPDSGRKVGCGTIYSTSHARNEAASNSDTGDGVKVAYPFTFHANTANELEVRVNGVLKTLTTDYTVTHNTPSFVGGTVTFSVAPPAAQAVLIERGTLPRNGVRIVLPTLAQMNAAGISAPFRDGQCEIQVVMGAPGPQQFLRIAMEGITPDDKWTVVPGGAADSSWGEFIYPYRTPGVISFQWNGVSWLLNHATPDVAELAGNGQLMNQGQGQLVRVTADPSWWTVGTKVGAVAYCPLDGRGLIGGSNGGDMLLRIPSTCLFHTATAGSAQDYLTVQHVTVAEANAIAQGAAYIAGTAPDGTVYAAGNYVLLKNLSIPNGESGNTVVVYQGKSTLGTQLSGNWIYKVIGADIELHQQVMPGGVSAPSRFVAGDTLDTATTPSVKVHALSLAAHGMVNDRKLWEPNGAEVGANVATFRPIVGMARRVGGTYVDDAKNRHTASWFNPKERKCLNNYTADRSTASLTFLEPNTEIRCNFTYLSGLGSSAVVVGDETAGRSVKYIAHITASNNTAANGCEFGISFDAGAAEPEIIGFTNPAGLSGHKHYVTLTGVKNGLSETTNPHFITLHVRAVTGGTCTVYSATTTIEAVIWQ